MNMFQLIKVLNYDTKENERLFVPNRIFNEFREIQGNVSNRAFCFSFYYLSTYLYRFTKYGYRDYNVSDLKKILGYSKDNKTMNKFIKRGGILNQMGYLEQTNNAPVSWKYTRDEGLDFTYYEDLIEEYGQDISTSKNRRNVICQVPILGLYKTEESKTHDVWDGSFFEIENTTMIPVKSFLFCMSNEELGVDGFWIYSLLKYKCDYYGGRWDASQHKMSEEIGVGKTRLSEILVSLEKHNMICNDHKPFVLGAPRGYKFESCSYSVTDSAFFNIEEQEIIIRDVMNFKRYCEENGLDYETEMMELTEEQ